MQNPYGYTNDPEVNKFHSLPNLQQVYAGEIFNYCKYLPKDENGKLKNADIVELVMYYALDNIFHYRAECYETSGIYFLPSVVVEQISDNVLMAGKSFFPLIFNDEGNIKLKEGIHKLLMNSDLLDTTKTYFENLL